MNNEELKLQDNQNISCQSQENDELSDQDANFKPVTKLAKRSGSSNAAAPPTNSDGTPIF